MPHIVQQPSATAHWYALVCDAEACTHRSLGETLESYLVFLLMRFINKTDIATRVLAMEYLESQLVSGEQQTGQLHSVGDICLLHAGLFPGRAKRRRVSPHYYVDLGRSAFYQLAQNLWDPRAEVFKQISDTFIDMTTVLGAIRQMRDGGSHPDLPSGYGPLVFADFHKPH
jgi:hypothetical protein